MLFMIMSRFMNVYILDDVVVGVRLASYMIYFFAEVVLIMVAIGLIIAHIYKQSKSFIFIKECKNFSPLPDLKSTRPRIEITLHLKY